MNEVQKHLRKRRFPTYIHHVHLPDILTLALIKKFTREESGKNEVRIKGYIRRVLLLMI